MAERVGYFSPEQAQEIWRWVKWLRKSKGQIESCVFGGKNMNAMAGMSFDAIPILAKNAGSDTIPRFGCVQATGITMQNDQCYLEVQKPQDSTGDAGPFFFNLFDECVHTKTGNQFPYTVVTAGPHMNAIASNAGSWSEGTRLSPQNNSYELDENPAGAFSLIGSNDGAKLGDHVVRVKKMAEQRRLMMFVAPSGGVPAKSGETAGTANCTPYESVSNVRTELQDAGGSSQTLEVESHFSRVIPEGDVFMAYWEWGTWVVINADCPS